MLSWLENINSWLGRVLSGFPWFIRIPIMVLMSLLCTIFPLPIDLATVSLGVVLEYNLSIWWYIFNILLLSFSDTLFGLLTLKLGNSITHKVIKKEKTKIKIQHLVKKLNNTKWTDFTIFIAAATPFPYTLTIYAASIIDYSPKKFWVINLFGRLLKYIIIGFLIRFGIQIVN